eukprot:CAMPEP_0181080042 /NCGR_PEP_ID=MMETSP1071-20121207/2355_1 /TAXON_ID=35127 /ORGANISM="Thalassiosira sp., Strain NH16" /LENGTH=405 /DNA_ID=CAMNT_0023161491 /DNA_START=35 /DNA_END=1252 /DNA_ORIENTATION=+
MPLPGWLTHAASFVGAAAAGVGILVKQHQAPGTITDNSMDRPTANRYDGERSKHMLPLLPIRIFQPNKNLVIAFDARTKNPLFVMERLRKGQSSQSESDEGAGTKTKAEAEAASRKNKRFHEEQTLLPYHRSRNQYYRNSGYDRGHLAPAADFPQKDKEMNDTFVLTNVSPQLPKFNRSTWLKLEEFVRLTAKKEGNGLTNETWVITGPLWLPSSATKTDSGGERFQYSFEGIGKPPSLVAVPTHFYKVVAVVEYLPEKQSARSKDLEVTGGNNLVLKKFAAFVLPNSDIIGGIRLVDHIVRLTDLEAATGLDFFPVLFGTANGAYGIPLQKYIADALTDDVRFHTNKIEQKEPNSSDLGVPLSNVEELSKGRQRKVKQLLRDNAPISFQHLCRNNDSCYKLLHV